MSEGQCQLGGRFRRCPIRASGTCQYCGRSFCGEHSHFAEGFEAVCTRKSCAAKQDDVQAHRLYVEDAVRLNRAGLCGLEGCNERRAFECSKCLGFYCPAHLSDQMYPATSRLEAPRRASVCPHCWDRRKIWSRR